ncbi:MAG: Rv3654c family TadE-like protein [Actinomycetes bacterium]
MADPMPPVTRPVRDARGSASLLASLVVLLIAALTGLLVMVGVVNAAGQRVRGAADLAALAGARAQGAGQDACAEAGRSAELNHVEVDGCRVSGDELEFVVSVGVSGEVRFGPWRRLLKGHAHAGMVTGAPE